MRIVRISDMTEEEKKKWEEQFQEDEKLRIEEKENETKRANELFNSQLVKNKTIQSSDITTDGWFHKSSLYDDNQGNGFTDTVGTALGTVGDVGLNLVHGIMGIGEGIGDALRYGIALGQDATGYNKEEEKTREDAKFNVIDSLFQPAQENIDNHLLTIEHGG